MNLRHEQQPEVEHQGQQQRTEYNPTTAGAKTNSGNLHFQASQCSLLMMFIRQPRHSAACWSGAIMIH